MVENSDFVNLVLENFNRVNKAFPQWSFKDLNTDISSGCNTSVVWAGNLITVLCFSFANWIFPYHGWDRWPPYNNKRGSSTSVLLNVQYIASLVLSYYYSVYQTKVYILQFQIHEFSSKAKVLIRSFKKKKSSCAKN